MRVLVGHKKEVRAVAHLPDGRLVSGGSDRTVRVWNVADGEPLHTVKTRLPVYAVAVNHDGDTIAFAGRSPGRDAGLVPIWTYRISQSSLDDTFAFPYRPPQHTNYFPHGVPRSVWSLSYSARGDILVAVGRVLGGGNVPNGGGGHWFRTDGTADGPIAAASAYAIRFAPSGTGYGVTSDSMVSFYTGVGFSTPTVSYPLTSQWAASLAFLPNSPIATVGLNSWLYFVNTTIYEPPTRIKTGFRTISSLDASADGCVVFVGGKPGGLEVYDTQSHALRVRYDFGVGGVHAVSVSPDGNTVALAGDDGLAVVDWDG